MPTIDSLLASGAPPVVAILRGLLLEEAVPVAQALIDAGIRMIEVPLNSPDPFASIAKINANFGEIAAIGAGTVLTAAAVQQLALTGGSLMVTPNTDPGLISHGIGLGFEVMPGFLSPTEALTAISAGARKLKMFPAGSLGTAHLKAMRDVLPRDVGIWAVGGVNADNARDWLAAGAEGIAVGGSLFRPGCRAEDVREKALALTSVFAG